MRALATMAIAFAGCHPHEPPAGTHITVSNDWPDSRKPKSISIDTPIGDVDITGSRLSDAVQYFRISYGVPVSFIDESEPAGEGAVAQSYLVLGVHLPDFVGLLRSSGFASAAPTAGRGQG